MAAATASEAPSWPPTPSTSTTIEPLSSSHLGFNLPYSFHDSSSQLSYFPRNDNVGSLWWNAQPDLAFQLQPSDPCASHKQQHTTPFLYAPPQLSSPSSSNDGLLQGIVPHASLFNSSEAEGMDHWFSSLRSDSLLGAFAQWHDSSSEDKLTSTRQEGSPKTVTVAQMISACEPDTPVEEPDKAQNTKRQRTGKRQSANRSTSSGSASHMSSGSPEPSPTASTSTSTELHAHSSNKSNNHNKRSKGGVLSSQQKRLNHIESEKRRRETIKLAFSALVQTLNEAHMLQSDDSTQSRPRGRGRKGEGTGGATKNVVLAKAVEHVRSLQSGNEALRQELARLEAASAKV